MPCSDCCPPPPPVSCPPALLNVQGTLKRDANANSRVIGIWTIDDVDYTLTFNLSNSMPNFTCAYANLSYHTTDELTGTRTFQGLIGRKKTSFTMNNHVSISGFLDAPIDVNASVNGTGVWQTS